jgi:transposase
MTSLELRDDSSARIKFDDHPEYVHRHFTAIVKESQYSYSKNTNTTVKVA